jgi:hypothetical protein
MVRTQDSHSCNRGSIPRSTTKSTCESMIKITVETSQKELINSLSANLSEFGDLYLQVASLPYFLSSIPSIRVFQYKINNYPRNIFWYSLDHRILNFLKQSELNIGFPTTLISPKKETITHTFNTINNQNFKQLHDNFLGKITEPKLELPPTESLDKPNLLIKYEDFVESNTKHNEIKIVEHYIEDLFNGNTISDFEPNLPESENIDTRSFLDKFKHKYNISYENKRTYPVQDFDEMITKVEKTKSTIKIENNKFTKKNEEIRTNFLDIFSKYKLQFNTTISLGLLLGLMFIFNIFPKNIFNVEVSSNLDQKTIEVKIPESQLKKTKVELKSTSQINTTPTRDIIPKNSIVSAQKVNLVNNSNGTVRFDSGGIILIAEKTGTEYRQKVSPDDPTTYSVPSQNLNNFISIEPTKATEDLPKDSVLKVFNLKGDALGYNFKAVVLEDNKSKSAQQSIFTESDQDSLKTKIESDLNEKRASFINSINNENNFSDPSWFKIISSDIKYDKDLNEKTDIVNAEALSVIEVYSVPKPDFKNTIEVKSNLGKIMDIQVMNSSIDDNKLINATFLVSFQDKTKISKVDIIKNLYSGEYNKVQEEFPSIKRISKESKVGINLPGISPVNQVNILEKDVK